MASTLTQLKYDEDIEYMFTDTFDMNELKCIEIEPDMVDDLQNGKLEIRGNANDESVLVTCNKSYKIRQHDSSNTILLTSLNNKHKHNKDYNPLTQNHENENESIYSAISCVYVLSEQAPKLNKLHEILYQRPYKGMATPEASPDDDDKENENKIDLSLQGLQLLVQCSDQQLLDGLEEINAIEINNEWRIIDYDYLCACFQDILYCMMEKSIDFKKFKLMDIVSNISEFPTVIVNHCVKMHCLSKGKEDVHGYLSFDEDKICIFCAKRILKQNGDKMGETEFISEWNNSLPYGLSPNKEMLIGHLISIYDKRSGENMWYIFEENELSLEAKIRFKQLFERKNEWNMNEIKPYLLSLIKSGLSVDKLLLKHTRMLRNKDNNGNEKRSYISRNFKRNR